MSLLSQATSGVKKSANMTILHGAPGVGKSTFASHHQAPIFLDIEDGSKRLNVTRLGSDKIPDFETLIKTVDELLTGAHGFKTVVLDSVTVLEKYAESAVCKEASVSSLKDVPWGGGPTAVREKIQGLVSKLKELQSNKDMEVVIISHSQVKSFTDPHLNATYDRNVLQCGDKVAHILVSAADNVFFCKYDVETKTEKNKPKAKAFGDGSRIMLTEWRPGLDAKNRLNLPFELPLDYKAFIEAAETAQPRPVEELKKEITELLSKAPEETKVAVIAAMDKAQDDQVKLIRIKAKLLTVVSA